jgi:dihydrofolate reductase
MIAETGAWSAAAENGNAEPGGGRLRLLDASRVRSEIDIAHLSFSRSARRPERIKKPPPIVCSCRSPSLPLARRPPRREDRASSSPRTLCMPAPRPTLFRHFIDVVAGHAGAIYGRRIYEVMRYWDVDRPEWDVAEREFAAAWQRQPKWVASRTLASVGPNATLIRGDLDAFVRDLKATVDGELDVAGPELAAALAPLIDEYRLYFRPYVLGGGKPYFAGARPPLRLVATDRIGEDVVRLTYVPA